MIRERTKAALARKKAAGARLGRPVTVPTEIRAKVAELRNAGLSIAAVAAALNEVGHRTSIGTEWSKARVQQIIASLALDAEAAG